MIKIVVNGVGGRMGRETVQAALGDREIEVVGAFEAEGSTFLGRSLRDLFGEPASTAVSVTVQRRDVLSRADVVIDFSVPAATASLLPMLQDLKTCVVIGTTGLGPEEMADVRRLSVTNAVLLSANLSEGINALFAWLPDLLGRLGEGWDVEIVEHHHRNKVDAPSGTALKIGEIVAKTWGRPLDEVARYGRRGRTGPRGRGEVCFHSIRGGGVPGEHRIVLDKGEEEVVITHRVYGRRVFACGAIQAAKGLAGMAPGLYALREVSGSR